MNQGEYSENIYEVEDTSWYSDKLMRWPRILLALVWYFGVHLFALPTIISIFLYYQLGWSYEQVTYKTQMISDVISGCILVLIMWPLVKDNLIRFKNNLMYTIARGVTLYIPTILVEDVVGLIIIAITGVTNSSNQNAIEEVLQNEFWGIAIPAVIVAPLIEELIFRGIIFRKARKWGFIPAALISGFAFGVLHCYSDVLAGDWASASYIALYMAMGFFMAKAYEDSNNLFGGVTLHFINNFLAVLMSIM